MTMLMNKDEFYKKKVFAVKVLYLMTHVLNSYYLLHKCKIFCLVVVCGLYRLLKNLDKKKKILTFCAN